VIPLVTARKLKQAGLSWTPALHDLFAIPERGMDERIFVISEMLVTVETVQGAPTILFQGASEWALDTLVTKESVWMPSEEQLRLALEAALIQTGRPEVLLSCGLSGCTCSFHHNGNVFRFESDQASEAYAAGLLFLLNK
jgi:hypothetical protein